jgi:hypothetical protein
MPAIVNAPLILDLGRTRSKDVRDLKRGRGKLLGDVHDAIEEVTASLGDQADGKQLVPVVLIYRRRARRRARVGGSFLPIRIPILS